MNYNLILKMRLIAFLHLLILFSCTNAQQTNSSLTNNDSTTINKPNTVEIINKQGTTITTRFNTPSNYKRIQSDSSSYAFYLQNLPLKSYGSPVLCYDGSEKFYQHVHEAVVDLGIEKRDLHQCADAIMRFRAEYLWRAKKYDQIHFNFTNGFRVDYSNWMNGQRIVFNGNRTSWQQRTSPSNTYKDFWKYLELIFSYAGTLSLSRELEPVPIDSIQIGDVFIQGGSPGHAIIVVDMAIDNETGKKIMMLAQSYMPAQETHILKNEDDVNSSPWYPVDFGKDLFTPEWTFPRESLMRFGD